MRGGASARRVWANQKLDKLRISDCTDLGSLICVYDQHGRTLFSKAKGSGAKDGLLGFTGFTVTVRFGSVIHTYDEHGMTIYSKAA
jgi:hypothetical protein